MEFDETAKSSRKRRNLIWFLVFFVVLTTLGEFWRRVLGTPWAWLIVPVLALIVAAIYVVAYDSERADFHAMNKQAGRDYAERHGQSPPPPQLARLSTNAARRKVASPLLPPPPPPPVPPG